MTYQMTEEEHIGLHHNSIFDSMGYTKKKPPLLVGGSRKKPDPAESDIGQNDNPNIADKSDLYKQNDVAMINSGYFTIPRDLEKNPLYQSARLKYKIVLQTILSAASYKKCQHSIGGDLFEIDIGQVSISIRRIVELCNQNVRWKEDHVDKNIVERAIDYFCKCQIVRQEVRHKRNIISVLLPGYCIQNISKSETASETKPRHNRDINKESKESKEVEKDKSFSNAENANAFPEKKSISSPKRGKREKKEPEELVEREQCVFTSKTEHEKLIKEKGSETIVKEVYEALSAWKVRNGITRGNDYKTAKNWNIQSEKKSSSLKEVRKKIETDPSPSNPKKNISFAEKS